MILFVILVFSLIFGINSEIKSVSVILFHGQSTPGIIYPGYGITEAFKKFGPDALTTAGHTEAYYKGSDFAKKYPTLLPKDDHLSAYSNAENRCVDSVSAFIKGYFDSQNSSTRAAVQMLPQECERYRNDMRQYESINETIGSEWIQRDRPYLNSISDYIGSPLNTIADVAVLADVIRVNQDLDPSTPLWLQTEYTLEKYWLKWKDLHSSTDYRMVVQGKTILTKIIDNMVAIADGNPAASKFQVFGVNEFTLEALSRMMGLREQLPKIPDYLDSITFELTLNENNTDDLEILIVYGTNSTEKRLQMRSCGSPCTLARFKLALSGVHVDDYNKFCQETI